MKLLKKPFAYATIFGMLLTGGFTYSMLKTFVISEAISTVSASNTTTSSQNTTTVSSSTAATTATNVSTTDTSYSDDNIQINLETITTNNTTVYVADIQVSSAEYLKTALAQNTYGTNITAKTSETAVANNAILAINGDYYGANSTGYVIKNGILYRDTVRDNASYGDLAIYADGSFEIVYEDEVTAQELIDQGVVNLLAFGPALVENGEIVVDTSTEVGRAMASNPRTAIGIIDENHYIIVVADGRTTESEGLSLYQMAEIMKEYGATTAYNLDGGGSSTLYFNGQVINNPTTNGNTISERAVSDIVYIGY
ncbi:phosphodiester glycosidase family protein [Streptococcus suis]|uniref:Phosphodiester glycosidase family protein n=2 Tax=Streptococcus TaxID=1301 RepID=A0A6L8MVB0_STRSU|nr:phosphodiester glycosidase family protein [Streptococcus parasuis]MCQ8267045.1 phosphodiester glycosidase family protein [Streptococcus suis]MDG4477550.1 phosphodiester glycosidase family protein [Streptococcus parasuis]MYN69068.1 phosphodiester glycosidase family protein [Streptococcus suis]NQK93973.1 phosphodiester glycosidase family protein [Streptococcus suis]NQN90410.1 phosphodiester glycosidase family protein [Streptococcus suis]